MRRWKARDLEGARRPRDERARRRARDGRLTAFWFIFTAQDTPMWRKGWVDKESHSGALVDLCNACGE